MFIGDFGAESCSGRFREIVEPTLGKNIRICDIAQPLAPKPFSITPGTPMPSLPKPKKGLGGFIGPDGSVEVDI